jgi:hypothetical protein
VELNKKDLKDTYPELPRIGYLHHPEKGHYVIYRYKHPRFIGMKFAKDKKPKPFQAVIQKNGSFTLDREYYSVDDISYYSHTPEEWYLKKTDAPGLYRKPLQYRVNLCLEYGHDLVISRDELSQLLDGKIEKEIDYTHTPTVPAHEPPVQEPDQPDQPSQPEPQPSNRVLVEYQAYHGDPPKKEWDTLDNVEMDLYSVVKIYKNARLLDQDDYNYLNEQGMIDLEEPTNRK